MQSEFNLVNIGDDNDNDNDESMDENENKNVNRHNINVKEHQKRNSREKRPKPPPKPKPAKFWMQENTGKRKISTLKDLKEFGEEMVAISTICPLIGNKRVGRFTGISTGGVGNMRSALFGMTKYKRTNPEKPDDPPVDEPQSFAHLDLSTTLSQYASNLGYAKQSLMYETKHGDWWPKKDSLGLNTIRIDELIALLKNREWKDGPKP